ncbi:MAG TPA: hypothetical protein EYP22_01310 [Methanosarcinales archaeon]|nr:hypothetical protein [Methanosarcinales archaeon]
MNLFILIPSSLTIESKDLKIKTYKVAQIARAVSVFRVDKIIIYKDKDYNDSKFISTILKYAETPQYLRKRLFALKKDLKYAGIIPPLRTPHHPINSDSSNLKIGEFRVGVVTKVLKNGASRVCWVDIGVERPALLQQAKVHEGEALNFRIVSIRPLKVELVNKKDIPLYWGYQTELANGLYETLKTLKKNSLVIATSKKGEVLDINLLKKIGQKMHKSNNTSIIFGSPIKGLDEILSNSFFPLKISDLSDYVINTIPNQGTETVRTEEAIFATLAQLNLVRRELRKGEE